METYEKRQGTSAILGQWYEIKIIMLTFIKAIISGFKFKLANNMKLAGDFDDVVINVKINDSQSKTVFLQAKHFENPGKKITLNDFRDGKNRFSLVKYFNAYMEIIRNKSELFAKGFNVDDAEFVIYTNANFDETTAHYFEAILTSNEVFEIMKSKYDTSLKIKPGNFQDFYSLFPTCDKKVVNKYLGKLAFLVKQGNESELEYQIKKCISLLFDEYNEEEICDIYLKSFNDYQLWWQNKGEVTFLTEHNNNYYKTHSSVCLLNKLNSLKTRLKNTANVKGIEYTDTCLEKLAVDIPQTGCVKLQTVPGAGILTVAKVLQLYKYKNIMFVDSEFVKQFHEKLECNFKNSVIINTLIYQVGNRMSEQFVTRISNIVIVNNIKRFIVICDEQINCEISVSVKDNIRYSDLSSHAQKNISDTHITFQSKKMYVKEVLGDCVSEMMYDDLLAKLLLQEHVEILNVHIGKLEYLQYIPRKFKKHYVDIDIKNKITDDVLLIQASRKDSLYEFFKGEKVKFYPEPDPKRKNRYNILSGSNTSRAFEELCENTTNVHLLKYDNSKLHWLQSNGSMKFISDHLKDHRVLNESEIVDCCSIDKLVVISDVAGMGKTTVLNSLAKVVNDRYPGLWILKINLSQHTEILHNMKERNGKQTVSEEILNSLTYSSESEKTFLKSMFAAGRVVVFLDGFDEISPDYEKIVIDFVKELKFLNIQQIYVTTRPQMREYIEQNLQTLCYNFVALDAEEQANFVSNEWFQNLSQEKQELSSILVKKLITKISSLSSQQDISICGIPLQLRMIVEIYPTYEEVKTKLENDEILTTLDLLYENFVTKKISLYCVEKMGLHVSCVAYKREIKEKLSYTLKEHQLIAINLIFSGSYQDKLISKEDQEKLVNIFKEPHDISLYGIVSVVHPKNSKFIHRTFAEYFSAMYLCLKLEEPKIGIHTQECVTEILVGNNYQVLRKFLNGMLGKYNIARPLLLVENYTQVHDSWEFNTPLHVAAKEKNIKLLIFLLKDLVPGTETAKLFLNSYDGKYTILQLIIKLSVSSEYLDVIDLLVKLDVNFNLRTRDGESVLHLSGNNVIVLEKILCVAAEKNESQKLVQNDALIGAVKSNNLDCVKLLISHNASVNWKDHENFSLLHLALSNGSIQIVKYLVAQGAIVNDKVDEDLSILGLAAVTGYLDIAKDFVERGANVNHKMYGGTTVLHYFAGIGHLDIVKFFIEVGANVNDKDNDGRSVLLEAVSSFYNIIKSMHQLGEIDFKEDEALPFWREAAAWCPLDIVKYLVEHGANVNDKENDGTSVLHNVAKNGHLDIVTYLVEYGAIVNDKDNEGTSILFSAATEGHIDTVKYLVDHGANVNDKDIYNRSVLHKAASTYNETELLQVDLVKYLVEHSANVNDKDKNGETALHVAACKSTKDVVQYLVENGANVNDKDNNDHSVLHKAASKGHIDTVEYLVEHGANVNFRDNYGRSVLHEAAKNGHIETVKYLVKRGANVNEKDINNRSVLHEAASTYLTKLLQTDIVKYLVEHSANVNDKDKNGETALHVAACKGTKDVVQYLVENGANVNNKDNNDHSVLHKAASKGHIDTVKYLVEHGANVNFSDNYGRSVLHKASSKGHIDTVKYLVERGANINLKDIDGRSVLHKASSKGHINTVTYLVEHGANVNFRDNDDRSVLHKAASKGHIDTVKYLVDHGANVNDNDIYNRSVLHKAASKGNIDTVKYLVEYNADVNYKDNGGRSVLYLAASNGHKDTVEFLVEKGSKVDDNNKDNESVMYKTASNGHLAIVKYLVEHGANVNDKDNNGQSILHEAASKGHLNRVKCFVEYGANVNDKDKQGESILYKAAYYGQLAITKYLVERLANVNDKDNYGKSVLHVAACNGHFAVVKYLVENRANVNDNDNNGNSVVYLAAKSRQLHIVQYLLKHVRNDTDINVCSVLYIAAKEGKLDRLKYMLELHKNFKIKDLWPLLYFAASEGHLDVVKYLVYLGTNINEKDNIGRSVLHKATRFGKFNIIKYLVQIGAKVNDKDMEGCSVLNIAVSSNHKDIMEYLIEHGANFYDRDNEGWTILYVAVFHGHLDIVKYLVKLCANVNDKDNEGLSVLHVAASESHLDIIIYLVEQGAKVNAKTEDGLSVLHVAASNGHLSIVQYLLELGANVNDKSDDGWSVLHEAATESHLDIIIYLVEKGAKVNAKTEDGSSVLHVAASNGHLSIVQYLVELGANVNDKSNDGWSVLHVAASTGHLSIVQYLVKLGANVNAKSEDGLSPLYGAVCSDHLYTVKYLVELGAYVNDKDNSGKTVLQRANGEINDYLRANGAILLTDGKESVALG